MYLPRSKIYMGKATRSGKGAQAAGTCLSMPTSPALGQAGEQLSLQQQLLPASAQRPPARREPAPGSAPAAVEQQPQPQPQSCLSSRCCQAGCSAVLTPSGSLNLAKLQQAGVCDPPTQPPSQSRAGSTAGQGDVLRAVTCFARGSRGEFSRLVLVFVFKVGWGEQDCFLTVMETGPCYAVHIIGCHSGASGDVDCAHLHKSKNKYTHKPLQSKYATDN